MESEVRIHAMDLFPTLSQIIGAKLPQDRIFDGESLLPLFEDKTLTRKAHQPFFYYNCENLQAVRKGPWKLHLPRNQQQLPFWDKNKVFLNKAQPVLYNLVDDRGETTNVAAKYPEVVQRMMVLAKEMRTELGEYLQRGKSQRPTGSVIRGAPIVSHEKDWGKLVAPATASAIAAERLNRHPNQTTKKTKTRRKRP